MVVRLKVALLTIFQPLKRMKKNALLLEMKIMYLLKLLSMKLPKLKYFKSS